MFNSKSKKSKAVVVKESSSLTVSKSDGDIVKANSSSYYERQESSSSWTTTKEHSSNALLPSTSKGVVFTTGLERNFNSKPQIKALLTDASPFQSSFSARPARSAFTSQPLTIKSTIFNPAPLQTNFQLTRSTNPTQNSFNDSNIEDLRNKLSIKVVKSTQFLDDRNPIIPSYRIRSKNRGNVLIINNIKFAKEETIRKGAEVDDENITELFRQLGFKTTKFKNLTKKEMEKKISTFSNSSSLKNSDICAVVIMSHGRGNERSDSTEVACTDGELLQTTWIINQFDGQSCPNLQDKAKLFIFQCCRGSNVDIVHYDATPMLPPRLPSDMLIAYSTVPGFISHRDPQNGTWYIQAICKVFMDHAHEVDVENLLKIVDNKLSTLIAQGSRQTTSFENRGFKTLYLHPKLWE